MNPLILTSVHQSEVFKFFYGSYINPDTNKKEELLWEGNLTMELHLKIRLHHMQWPSQMLIFLQVSPVTPNISDLFAPTLFKANGDYSPVNWPPGNSTSLLFWPKNDHVGHHTDRVMVAQLQATVEQVITSILVHATYFSCRDHTHLCGKI